MGLRGKGLGRLGFRFQSAGLDGIVFHCGRNGNGGPMRNSCSFMGVRGLVLELLLRAQASGLGQGLRFRV